MQTKTPDNVSYSNGVMLTKLSFEKTMLSIYMDYMMLNFSVFKGFPGGAVVKNLPANAGDTDSSPGPGRSHMPRSN